MKLLGFFFTHPNCWIQCAHFCHACMGGGTAHMVLSCGTWSHMELSLTSKGTGACLGTVISMCILDRWRPDYMHVYESHLILASSCTTLLIAFYFSWQISRSGRILSEKDYRLNAMRKDHQNYIRECLAQAIFHKVLDMEVWLFYDCFSKAFQINVPVSFRIMEIMYWHENIMQSPIQRQRH